VIGTTLSGRYRLERKLGSGGMSIVYLGHDGRLDRWVAVKVMHQEFTDDMDQIERFAREARSVAKLSHPNIVSVIDAGEDAGHFYIVFEYVEGETLKQLIDRVGPLPLDDAVAYAIEIGRGLAAAHAWRLVHRDVKPQNVLIDSDGRARVTDFGIARTEESERLTQTGRVIGTTDYVSPEQAMGHAVDERTDIYSLGIVLYEMLTGEVPFTADSVVGVAMKHVNDALPDVQRRRPGVSASVAAVLDRATAKDPAYRYAVLAEFVNDLEDALQVEAVRAGHASEEATSVLETVPSKRRLSPSGRIPRVAIAAVLLAIIAVPAVALLSGGSDDRSEGQSPRIAVSHARDFDPEGGDGEHPEEVGLAIDSDPTTTGWSTETYSVADFGDKEGVGIFLDAGKPAVASQLEVRSNRAGWNAEVLAAASGPPPILTGWTPLEQKTNMSERETLKLDSGGERFRYYLLWITRLAPADDGFRVQIDDVRLER
jgi:serine/threonine-protein kinase